MPSLWPQLQVAQACFWSKSKRTLFDFGLFIEDMFPDFRIKLLCFHFIWVFFFILGGRIVMTCFCRWNQFDFLSHYAFSPKSLRFSSTWSIPCLSIVLRPFLDKRSFTNLFWLSTQILCVWRFGRNFLLVLLWAWDTLFPLFVFLPVTWHTLAIFVSPRRYWFIFNSGRLLYQ